MDLVNACDPGWEVGFMANCMHVTTLASQVYGRPFACDWKSRQSKVYGQLHACDYTGKSVKVKFMASYMHVIQAGKSVKVRFTDGKLQVTM